MRIRKLSFGIVIFFMSFYLCAENPMMSFQYPEFNLAKILATGTPYVSQNAGFQTLFTNPALFSRLNKTWNITSTALAGQFFDNGANFDIKLDLMGPIAFGLTNKNFAFGIFNTTRLKTNSKTAESLYDLILGEELFLTGGYGAELFKKGNHALLLGIQMKGYIQGFSIALNNPLPSSEFSILELAKKSLSADKPIRLSYAVGFDTGFLYSYNTIFEIGVVIRDLYTASFSTIYKNLEDFKNSKPEHKTQYKTLLPKINIGFSVSPKLPEHYSVFTGYTFYFQYNDALSALRNKQKVYYNLASGMEFEFNEAYYIRLGINALLPCFGLGVDAKYFELNASFMPWKKLDTSFKKLNPCFGVELSLKY